VSPHGGAPEARFVVEGRQGLHLGPILVSFQRTAQTRGAADPPASHGAAPLVELRKPGAAADLLIPVDDAEAIWLGLEPAVANLPAAVRVQVMAPVAIDAVTGGDWTDELSRAPQNYLVCPPQRSLDGVQAGPGRARQLVRHAGPGMTADSCVEVVLLRITSIPRGQPVSRAEGPSQVGPLHDTDPSVGGAARRARAGSGTGVPQLILVDPYPLDGWDTDAASSVTVQLADPAVFTALTGRPAPSLVPEADRYLGWRLP
jgi:hypothetical protein